MSDAVVEDVAVLDRVYGVILSRRDADPEESHVARLFHKGTRKIAQKLGEEAVETVIAAMSQKRKDIIGESADLMFHLLVLWADAGIRPQDVWAELARREGTSGIDEKKKRIS
jgi:phosphoribosyl-ATP pyrophosphohydrolase